MPCIFKDSRMALFFGFPYDFGFGLRTRRDLYHIPFFLLSPMTFDFSSLMYAYELLLITPLHYTSPLHTIS